MSLHSLGAPSDTTLDPILSLYTDLYELTMAYGYWKADRHELAAVFYLYFRENPFQGGYVVSAGQRTVAEYLEKYYFGQEALDFLAEQRNSMGDPLFEKGFLNYLKELRLSVQIECIEEGRVAFPSEPLLKISGPILECLLLEGPLLNIIGFQSLIATKAARISEAAQPDPVMEFGLRRAHSLQAASWASRAAYIGGIESTSNVAAGLQYGIPLRGTHAHSWIMSFDSELEAFRSSASLLPQECTLLVDTYETQQGIQNAIQVGKEMAQKGQQLQAIRIDSGDLAYLSQEARRQLDEAGLKEVQIIASGDIDEHIILSLKQQKASVSSWGVGTQLSTSFSQPALGAVYKLCAIQSKNGWKSIMKVSDTLQKASIPGRLELFRFSQRDGAFVADMITEQGTPPSSTYTIISPHDPIKRRVLDTHLIESDPLLRPLNTSPLSAHSILEQARARCQRDLSRLHPTIRRIKYPHVYPVGLEEQLYKKRIEMMKNFR